MTYRQLLNRINDLPMEHLDDNVTILLLDTDEIHGASNFVPPVNWEEADADYRMCVGLDQVNGVLDKGHPYITVEA